MPAHRPTLGGGPVAAPTRPWPRALLIAAVFAALTAAYVRGQQFGVTPAALTVLKVAADLYVINNEIAPGNATALVTEQGVLLVDDKFAVDHDTMLAALKTVTSQPIRYVVNTHYHADHTGGNAKLLQMNIPIVASEQARRNIHSLSGRVLFVVLSHLVAIRGRRAPSARASSPTSGLCGM